MLRIDVKGDAVGEYNWGRILSYWKQTTLKSEKYEKTTLKI